MKEQQETNFNSPGKEVFIKMVLSAWETQNIRMNAIIEKLSDEQLQEEVAPGRNRGIYLLGHLAAVNDGILPLLGFEEKLYPELENIFLLNPDKSGFEMPSVAELKKYWNDINAKLAKHIEKMQPDEWFTKHAAVSVEDFVKEPHRNKLNILVNRANHQSYHLGQLAFLN